MPRTSFDPRDLGWAHDFIDRDNKDIEYVKGQIERSKSPNMIAKHQKRLADYESNLQRHQDYLKSQTSKFNKIRNLKGVDFLVVFYDLDMEGRSRDLEHPDYKVFNSYKGAIGYYNKRNKSNYVTGEIYLYPSGVGTKIIKLNDQIKSLQAQLNDLEDQGLDLGDELQD